MPKKVSQQQIGHIESFNSILYVEHSLFVFVPGHHVRVTILGYGVQQCMWIRSWQHSFAELSEAEGVTKRLRLAGRQKATRSAVSRNWQQYRGES